MVRRAGGSTTPCWPYSAAEQIGEERLSSVHYLKFDTKGRVPVAVGVDLEGQLVAETELEDETRAALREDLD